MKTIKVSVLALSMAMLSACANLEVTRKQVEPDIPTQFEFADPTAMATPLYWENIAEDPVLQNLIHQALENNRDLRVALANVDVARQFLKARRAQFFPIIGAAGQAMFGSVEDGNELIGNQVFNDTTALGGNVTAWEIDLFGRLRNQRESALQTYLASQDGMRSAKILVVSGVMAAYMQLAADIELLRLTELTVQSQKESLDLTQQFLEVGTGSELDVNRAASVYHARLAQLAQYRTLVRQDFNALQALVGTTLSEDLTKQTRMTPFPVKTGLEVTVDSQVLLERPDIRAAEHQLEAQRANIKAARANYFPQITLSGAGGWVSGDLDDLFSDSKGALGWSFGPSVYLPIFDGGRRDAAFEASKALRDAALARYESAIQSAFKETADALVAAEYVDDAISAFEAYRDNTAKVLELSEMRFKNGIDSYFSVLDAQREDFSARQQLIQARLIKGQTAIALYKAMGSWPGEPSREDAEEESAVFNFGRKDKTP